MLVVTGANGFIGSAIIWELNRLNWPVLAAVDSIPLAQRSELLRKRNYNRFIQKDDFFKFLDQKEVQESVTWVIHMGANSSTTEKNWDHLLENNTEFTNKIFSWCAKHGKSMIYASSAATYGAGELGYSDELDSNKLKPLNLYGESKVLSDRWALEQSFGQKPTPPHWYGLRFFNVFGPNEYFKNEMASIVFKSFHQIKKTGQFQLFKSHRPDYQDGEQKRDFVYVKDVVRWIVEIVERGKTAKPLPSGIYNMGFGAARTWNDLINSVYGAMERKAEIAYADMPDSVKNQYQYYTCADMTKWQKFGMSAPQWPLEKAVKDYVQNHLMNPDPYL